MMNKRAALILLAPLALAACQKAPTAPADSQSAIDTVQATRPVETGEPHGRLVLAVIAGHPGAAYVAWRNTGATPVTVTGVQIAGATKAEMHETKGNEMLPLPKLVLTPGEDANFAPGGRHVMVYGLSAKVKAGDKLPYTLLLSDGSKRSGTLDVEEAGAAPTHDMKM